MSNVFEEMSTISIVDICDEYLPKESASTRYLLSIAYNISVL